MSDIPKKLAATGKWSENTAWLSVRAGHKCEYCGLDFLASVANYKSFQVDHIVPICAGGANTNDNLAIACKTCNFDLKTTWDPRSHCQTENREQLINVIRSYINERREHYQKEIDLMKSILGVNPSS